jgi:hypothetical protein
VLGTAALFLFWSEKHPGSRAVFFNFAFFFLENGFAGPLQSLISKWLGFLHADIETILYQYFISFYFLLLSICVVYLIVECTTRSPVLFPKYIVTFLVVGLIWTPWHFRYISDPDCLHEAEDMQDFRTVKKAIAFLGQNERYPLSASAIAAAADSSGARESDRPLTETRVAEMLSYTQANDYAVLFFRPFWRSCAIVSTINVLFMIGLFLMTYFRDPPGGAYLEKIGWCTTLYCLLEAIHFYFFMNVGSWDVAVGFMRVGGFVSLAAMVPLGYLFCLRYLFVNSIEGSYYEKQITLEATRVTRWRDKIDNWLLRQFVVESNLDRRFLIRRERGEGERKDGDKSL